MGTDTHEPNHSPRLLASRKWCDMPATKTMRGNARGITWHARTVNRTMHSANTAHKTSKLLWNGGRLGRDVKAYTHSNANIINTFFVKHYLSYLL